MKKILKIFAVLMAVGLAAGTAAYFLGHALPAQKGRKILYYRNPMGKPDISPLPKKDEMGMDYIPVYEGEGSSRASQVPGHAAVEISTGRQALIGIELGKAEKRDLVKTVRTIGRLGYEPKLYAAQRELIDNVRVLRTTPGGLTRAKVENIVQATRSGLKFLGMTDEEIQKLEDLVFDWRRVGEFEAVKVPLSLSQGIWGYAVVYQPDMPYLQPGSRVKVRALAFPDREFQGELRAFDREVHELSNPDQPSAVMAHFGELEFEQESRSLRARIHVEDPEGLLHPGMDAEVRIEKIFPSVLSVPKQAVLRAGERDIVFVRQGEGWFDPHEVNVGAEGDAFYEIRSGLKEGETIVTSANFLIDSESRLEGALQAWKEGGHAHGT